MDHFKIGLLEPLHFSLKAISDLQALGRVFEYHENTDLESFVSSQNIIFVRLKRFLGADFFRMTPQLQYICTPTTGLNHIDLKAARERNIQILSLKGEADFLQTVRATPEHIFGLVLALLRNYRYCFLHPDNRAWDREKYRGNEICNNSIGIIGLGRVGKLLAKYFQAFDAEVFFYDINPSVKSSYAAKVDSIEGLIEKVNIVLLCASYSSEDKHFFSKAYIDRLKGKYFVNASRGENVDEAYLISKIEENWFKGIAIDVISNETMGINIKDKLLSLVNGRNMIVTPHIGGATYQSMWKTEEFLVKKLKHILKTSSK